MASVTGIKNVHQRPFYSIQRVEIPRQVLGSGTTTGDTVDSKLFAASVSNPTAGDLTFSMVSNDGNAIATIPAQTIPANTLVIFVMEYGDAMAGGWQAITSDTGLTLYAVWDRES